KFVKSSEDAPPGLQRIDYAGPKLEKGAGSYYAPQDIANLMNRWLSPSLWSRSDWVGKTFQTLMRLKNVQVAIRLGLSAYHAMSTSVSAISSRLTLAVNQLRGGDVLGAAKSLATALPAPLQHAMKQGDIIDAWNRDKSTWTPQEAQAMDLLHR